MEFLLISSLTLPELLFPYFPEVSPLPFEPCTKSTPSPPGKSLGRKFNPTSPFQPLDLFLFPFFSLIETHPKNSTPKSRFCSGSGWILNWINQSHQQRRVSHYFCTNMSWIDTNNFTSILTHPHVNHEWRNTFKILPILKIKKEKRKQQVSFDFQMILCCQSSFLPCSHIIFAGDRTAFITPSWNPRDTDPSLHLFILGASIPSLKSSYGRGS